MPANFDAAYDAAYKATPSPRDGQSNYAQDWDDYYTRLEEAIQATGWSIDEFWDHYASSNKYIADGTDKWLAAPCTFELSVDAAYIKAHTALLHQLNKGLVPEGARWMAQPCDTCSANSDGKSSIHLSIETYDFCPYSTSHFFDEVPA